MNPQQLQVVLGELAKALGMPPPPPLAPERCAGPRTKKHGAGELIADPMPSLIRRDSRDPGAAAGRHPRARPAG